MRLRRPLVHSLWFVSLVLAASVSITPVKAQSGVGLHAGVSVDPEQFYLGGQADFGPVVERLWFRPNIDIGFGDHRTLFALNGEFAYWFPPFRTTDWRLYAGAGPAINIYHYDRGFRDDPPGFDETKAKGGFNFLAGLSHPSGFFGELKVGAWGSPAVRFAVGYTFH